MFPRFMADIFGAKEEAKEKPPITTATAILLLIFYTVLYVASFYLSPTTRPSPTVNRDDPLVIRGRIRAVSSSCLLCLVSTFGILTFVGKKSPVQILHQLGFFPFGFWPSIKSVLLTVILYLGPLYEKAIVKGRWRDWYRLRHFKATINSWTGWRDLVAGPVTEELLFRSTAIPVFLLAQTPQKTVIYLTPLIFGLAHIQHLITFVVSNPGADLAAYGNAIFIFAFQLLYTTIFGAFETFVYLRTGSLLAVILNHSFCNWQGLPRVWGRLRAQNGVLHWAWTFAYYVLLVTGAILFYKLLFPLTESPDPLASFK